MDSERSPSTYGLDEVAVLEAVREMAPELFAACNIATLVDNSMYPIRSEQDLLGILEIVGGSELDYSSDGIHIRQSDLTHFPQELLPIIDRIDLIRKIYMAIIRTHQGKARDRMEQAKRGEYTVESSHPFAVGDL